MLPYAKMKTNGIQLLITIKQKDYYYKEPSKQNSKQLEKSHKHSLPSQSFPIHLALQ
jgi:hypothetical protein